MISCVQRKTRRISAGQVMDLPISNSLKYPSVCPTHRISIFIVEYLLAYACDRIFHIDLV